MKRVKILLLFVVMLFLTGCSGTYNLKINSNLTVDESINILIPEEKTTYDNTVKIFKDNKINKNKYKVVKTDNKVKIEYKESYSSIEDYIINSKLYRNLFNNIDYKNTDNEIKLSTESKLDLSGKNSNYIVNNNDISLLQINVESDYKVINNNADKKEKKVYTWVLNSNTNNKKISLALDIKHKKNDYIQKIVLLLIATISIFGVITVLNKIKKSDKFI